MCVVTADGLKPLPQKEITMKKWSKPARESHRSSNDKQVAVPALPNQTDKSTEASKKKRGDQTKAESTSKRGKSASPTARSASATTNDKLVCRYCGSDDLSSIASATRKERRRRTCARLSSPSL
jgi:hypothetical protein